MLLERTITTLQSRADTPERAVELGKLGYLQWLAWLRPGASFPDEADRALRTSRSPVPAAVVARGNGGGCSSLGTASRS